MNSKLHLKFDPNQEYQLAAINNVVKLFDGLSKYERGFVLGDEIVPNLSPDKFLYEDFLLENLKVIQRENQIPENVKLEVDDGLVMEEAGYESWRSPSFTIEMETGTGKTYVYLRTIYELRKNYGFSKFIIVVPSVAIYEGVKKTSQIAESHFRSLYGNEVVNLISYDGAQISKVRSFATSTFTQIMIMTVASFNSIKNNLYKPSEKLPGERIAYHYIQETRPILILDEPQSIDNTDKAKEAIRTLHPLFTLRYSATHKVKPNLLYRLTPIDAYRQNLVKKIQVIGISEEENLNGSILTLDSVTKSPITAKIKTLVNEKGTLKEVIITLRQGDNLFDKTRRDEHQSGYRVEEINVARGSEYVRFENTSTIYLKENLVPSRPEIFRSQIRETIKQHMEVQNKLYPQEIKVLSLFFVDRVANYTENNGIICTIFDQEFEQLKNQYSYFQKYSPEQVREGYFATKIQSGQEIAIDTESRNQEQREAEKKAFELIMRKKEQLLSLDEPVSFIFAHSALKEGWDNPNVFQICTLNQTTSEIKKRQEIGRGLRLCVDQTGARIFDEDINVLTVIANESYEEYAANLQREYVEAGEDPPPKPKRPQQSKVKRNDELFNTEDFQKFWDKLCQQTKYQISVNSKELIQKCVENLNGTEFSEPKIVLTKGKFVITEYILKLESVNHAKAVICLQKRSTEENQDSNALIPVDRRCEVNKGNDLSSSKFFDDPCLRGFKVLEVIDKGNDSIVKFTHKEQTQLTKYQSIVFTSEKGQIPDKTIVQTLQDNYPVFNLIDRAAKETKLTRATLNRIFQGMLEEKKLILFRNPEGFASTFITVIKEVATSYVVSNIKFILDSEKSLLKADELFPAEKSLAQQELIDAGQKGLYDQVQIDSDVEKRFVEYRLLPDNQVVLYFKFPPLFKVKFPKAIGNYNPDWGIIRKGDNGEHILQLVRETKGQTNVDKLRFAQEPLKIECAKRHFEAIGIDYRVIDDKIQRWWEG